MFKYEFTLFYLLFVKVLSELDDNSVPSFSNNEFQCETGELIQNHYLCDGYSDCKNDSDENSLLCANKRCPSEIGFQCAYGGCIELEKKCDGILDCLDFSDEDQLLCGYSTRISPGCEKPTRLTNAGCSIIDCEQNERIRECTEDMDTKNVCIELTCEQGYILSDYKVRFKSRCVDDVWDPQLPICQECGIDNRSTTSVIDANRPVPWHAGLYRVTKDKTLYFCGGTIVHYKAVITAARCLRKFKNGFPEELFPLSELTIAVGKKFRDFYANETNEQKFKVIDVKIRDYTEHFENDLAILILNEKIQPNQDVMPVCLQNSRDYDDWTKLGKTFYNNAPVNQSNLINDWPQPDSTTAGKIVGWRKSQTGEDSKILKEADFTICCDYKQCVKKVNKDERRWVSPDKFCIDHTIGNKIGQGDDGGGFIIKYHGRHYLYGIVSLGTNRMRLFTFLGFDEHRPWVFRNLDVN